MSRFGLALAVAAALVALPARAQVNVEPLRDQLEDRGYTARLAGSFVAYRGNTEGVVLGAGTLFGLSSGRHMAYLNATGDYSRLGGETQVEKTFAHLRYNYQLMDWLWAEAYGQLSRDRFRRIALRELVGTGPRVQLLDSEPLRIFLGTGYMLEHTVLNDDVPVADKTQLAHRWASYFTISYQPHERVALSNTTYYQPRFDDFSDYHLLSVSGLEFRITELLRSSIDATVRYESVVPPGVETTDIELKNSIALQF